MLSPLLKHFQNATFCLYTILFILSIYIILKKSSAQMTFYKYLMLNQFTWCYLFEVLIFLWQPVVLFPDLLGYSEGLFKYLGKNSAQIALSLIFLNIVGMIHSLYFSIIYRVVQVFLEIPTYRLFKNGWHLFLTFAVTLGFFEIILGGMFYRHEAR